MPTPGAAIIRWCRALATHSEHPGNITRTCLSTPMRAVHRDLGAWMTTLGLVVRVDAAGNLRGLRRSASHPSRRLYIGSHLDTVPNAGAFDGVLGVVWAIALLEQLGNTPLPFDIEVLGFSDEEGVRFGVPFIGSRALVGTLDDDLLGRQDRAGITLADALADCDRDPSLDRARAESDAIGYLECHIEQGPVLDHLGLPTGIVEAIAGQTRSTLTFSGFAGHAGTTPMSLRRDAAVGAAEWILAVEDAARNVPGAVATVGRVETMPGAGNVIAGACTVTLDVRHAVDETRQALTNRLVQRAEDITKRRGLSFVLTNELDQAAVAMDASLTNLLDLAADRCGFVTHRMTSGAGHDAMVMARQMPVAMLFLRSPGGVSHHPDESVLAPDVDASLAIGLEVVRALAAEHHE